MPTKSVKSSSRNRSAEALAKGRVLRAFELSAEADQSIDAAAAHLGDVQTRATGAAAPATRVQALEWLIRQGAKKIPKKIPDGLD